MKVRANKYFSKEMKKYIASYFMALTTYTRHLIITKMSWIV